MFYAANFERTRDGVDHHIRELQRLHIKFQYPSTDDLTNQDFRDLAFAKLAQDPRSSWSSEDPWGGWTLKEVYKDIGNWIGSNEAAREIRKFLDDHDRWIGFMADEEVKEMLDKHYKEVKYAHKDWIVDTLISGEPLFMAKKARTM